MTLVGCSESQSGLRERGVDGVAKVINHLVRRGWLCRQEPADGLNGGVAKSAAEGGLEDATSRTFGGPSIDRGIVHLLSPSFGNEF